MIELAELWADLLEHFWNDDEMELDRWDFEEMALKRGLMKPVIYDSSMAELTGRDDDLEEGDLVYVLTDTGRLAKP
mgnify:CR=1 FL=1